MGFGEAIPTCFRKYVTFSGRARRPEYWWFAAFVVVGALVADVIDRLLFGGIRMDGSRTAYVRPLFTLLVFLPLLAAGWRRMHDTGRPGWYLLLPLLVTLAIYGLLILGVLGFAGLEEAGADEYALRSAASGFGMVGLAAAGIAQLGLTILVIWWLTRPSVPGTNAWGAPPEDWQAVTPAQSR